VAGALTTVPVHVGGVTLDVEVARVGGSEQTSTLNKARDAVAAAFDQAQEAILAVGASTVVTIDRLGERAAGPDEVVVKFGLKFTAAGGVVVAGVSGEATLEVSLTYKRPPIPSPGSSPVRK
jgi:hypothetical protein